MARLNTCGWETASQDENTIILNYTLVLIESTITRNAQSKYSLNITSNWGTAAILTQEPPTFITPVLADTWYVRFYMYIPSAPSATAGFFNINGATLSSGWAATGISLQLNTDRTISLVYNNVVKSPASAALSTGAWHKIEVRGVSGASGQGELRVDGSSVVSVSGATGDTTAFTQFGFGTSITTARGISIYIDDFALNDSNGAAQNSWVPDSNLLLMLPTADSAVGTGWTTSGAATSSLYTNVDNIPPVGIADTTSSAGHQIRNATSNANSAYDTVIQTYTAAGLAADDTVNVVQAVGMTATASATSPKSGTLGIVSNPTGSQGNLSYNSAGTANLFYAGGVAGTYPTNWKASLSPSVAGDIASGNRGTGPVVRLNQVTSSVRVAMCCLLGLYVDYTPAVAASTNPHPIQVFTSAAINQAALF